MYCILSKNVKLPDVNLLCIYRFPFVAVSIAFAVNKEVRQIKQDKSFTFNKCRFSRLHMWMLIEHRLLSWSSAWCTAAWRTRCIKQGGGRELSATMIGSLCPTWKVMQSDDMLLCTSESGKKVMKTRNNTIHEFCSDYKCHPVPLKHIYSRIWAESSRSKRLHIQFGWL